MSRTHSITLTAAVGSLVLSAFSAFAQAEKLLDAATAASQLYQNVMFQDVIKAVSKSKRHDGFYLSFGAPYPKQVLSVWASNDTYSKLPGAGALVGRTVRITGLVNPGAEGPILYLESPAQFRLLRVDPALISKPVLEGGKTDRHQFVMAIREHLQRNDFDTIEVLARDLHESHERFADGSWLLDAFFGAFKLGPERSNQTFLNRAQKIAEWKARYPDSILPVLVEARFHIDLGWKWRGTDDASKVAKEDWQHFQEEIASARQVLEANPQAKASPDYFAEMQTIALSQGWKKDDYFRLFAEAVRREPDYYRFYFDATHYLLPRWNGKPGEWEQFAEEQRQKRGGADGDALYARIAWSKADEYRHHLFDQTAISWEKMAAGFDALIQQYPDSNYLKSAYAYFAWEAKDRARLGPALQAIKAHPDMDIWVNLENVEFAKKFANGETFEPAR